MFCQLPPVGHPVRLSVSPQPVAEQAVFQGWQLHYYASGTAALAAAMRAAATVRQQRGQVAEQVILPAYGCPDLVAAANFAGLAPVLVDLEAQRPWYDLQALSNAVTENTAAIVAVNLFGINERHDEIRRIAEVHDIVLIEDSAQAFPSRAQSTGFWQGDLVVLSFGRGKPLSLMGGGAVLAPADQPGWQSVLASRPFADDSVMQAMRYRLKVMLYNAMIKPWLYWLPQSLPFLHLGETRYHRLAAIDPMAACQGRRLTANLQAYHENDEAIAALIGRYREQSAGRLMDLAAICDVPGTQRLLRYPLLLERDRRDRVLQAMQRAGLGVSRMYPAAMPAIEGVPSMTQSSDAFPNAVDFAARILTLPVLSRVSQRQVETMWRYLK